MTNQEFYDSVSAEIRADVAEMRRADALRDNEIRRLPNVPVAKVVRMPVRMIRHVCPVCGDDFWLSCNDVVWQITDTCSERCADEVEQVIRRNPDVAIGELMECIKRGEV